ncbi:hypothetical protein V8C37DRAFT_120502 [Trichoderma ceciliae]
MSSIRLMMIELLTGLPAADTTANSPRSGSYASSATHSKILQQLRYTEIWGIGDMARYLDLACPCKVAKRHGPTALCDNSRSRHPRRRHPVSNQWLAKRHPPMYVPDHQGEFFASFRSSRLLHVFIHCRASRPSESVYRQWDGLRRSAMLPVQHQEVNEYMYNEPQRVAHLLPVAMYGEQRTLNHSHTQIRAALLSPGTEHKMTAI